MEEKQKDQFNRNNTDEPSIQKKNENNKSQPIPGDPNEIKHDQKTEVPNIGDSSKEDVNDKVEDPSITDNDQSGENASKSTFPEDTENGPKDGVPAI